MRTNRPPVLLTRCTAEVVCLKAFQPRHQASHCIPCTPLYTLLCMVCGCGSGMFRHRTPCSSASSCATAAYSRLPRLPSYATRWVPTHCRHHAVTELRPERIRLQKVRLPLCRKRLPHHIPSASSRATCNAFRLPFPSSPCMLAAGCSPTDLICISFTADAQAGSQTLNHPVNQPIERL